MNMAHIKIGKEGLKFTSLGLFWMVFFTCAVGLALSNLYNYGFQDFIKLKSLFTFFWVTGVLTFLLYVPVYLVLKNQILTEAINNIKSIDKEVDILQSNIEEDFFNKLVKINFKYI